MTSSSFTGRDLLGIVVGFTLLHIWLGHSLWLYLALGIGLSGILSTRLATRIQKGWHILTKSIGRMNGYVLLSLLYLVILTPLAWLYRLGKNDPLFFKHQAKSYFHEMEKTYTTEDLQDMW
ncbi:MAG: SxtJ family membrane protein [Bacteroidota bacterium]